MSWKEFYEDHKENVDEVNRAPDSKRKFPADGGLGFAKPGSEHLLLSVNSEGVLEGNGYSQPAGGWILTYLTRHSFFIRFASLCFAPLEQIRGYGRRVNVWSIHTRVGV